jgi:hypothetical protein
MPPRLLSLLRFHVLRVMRAEPLVSAAAAGACALAVLAGLAFLLQTQRLAEGRAELSRLEARARTTGPVRPPEPAPGAALLGLPPFSSASLVATLHDMAADSGLALDEINYALEDNGNQPYLRYRITLEVSSTYPLVRRLAEQLSLKVGHLTLDNIHCERKDVAAAELKCDLALSGFFAKDGRG